MSETPKISICIPTYNGAKYLAECLDSCIRQSFADYEIVICDDGSSDDTLSILEDYKGRSARIRLFRNEKNLGLVGNWNRCIEKSTGEWIKFVFQDDYITSDCLEQFAGQINETNVLIVSKRHFILPADSTEKERHYYAHQVRTLENTGYYAGPQFNAKTISAIAVENICLNFIGEPSLTMFKKDVVGKTGRFDPEFRQICDLEFMQRVATNFGLTYLPVQNCYFRIHRESTTERNLNANNFYLRHIEPVLLSYKMLYAGSYASFRRELSYKQQYRLKTYFKVRTFEAGLNSLHQAADKEAFDTICKQYKEIGEAAEGSNITKFKFFLLKQVRKRR